MPEKVKGVPRPEDHKLYHDVLGVIDKRRGQIKEVSERLKELREKYSELNETKELESLMLNQMEASDIKNIDGKLDKEMEELRDLIMHNEWMKSEVETILSKLQNKKDEIEEYFKSNPRPN